MHLHICESISTGAHLRKPILQGFHREFKHRSVCAEVFACEDMNWRVHCAWIDQKSDILLSKAVSRPCYFFGRETEKDQLLSTRMHKECWGELRFGTRGSTRERQRQNVSRLKPGVPIHSVFPDPPRLTTVTWCISSSFVKWWISYFLNFTFFTLYTALLTSDSVQRKGL